MHNKFKLLPLIITSALIGFGASVQAAPVTISASDFVATNYTPVANTFGDTASVDFTWDTVGTMLKWNGDYSGNDAFFCAGNASSVCTFSIVPLGGLSLTIDSFMLGGWQNANRDIVWSVTDLGSPAVLSGTANVPGSSPLNVVVGLSSTAGFNVTLGPDAFNGGLVSLTYTTNQTSAPNPIPTPGTLTLLGLGLLGLGAIRRRLV